MVQDSPSVLAEQSARAAHPAEADLPQGKATDGAGCDMEVSRMLEALPALSPAELRSEVLDILVQPRRDRMAALKLMRNS
jgi:hypothetical protein